MKHLTPKLIILLFSLFLYIPFTNAFFQDSETSSDNSFSAASLDFYLETLQDFDIFLLPDNPQTRDLNFHNSGSLPVFYNIGTSQTGGNADVCQALKGKVKFQPLNLIVH